MNKYKKLVKNSGIFMVANFGSKFLTLLLGGVYTNVLTTAEYGLVDVFITTSNLSIPIVTCCIVESVLRFSIDEIDSRKKIYSTGLLFAFAGSIIFLVTIPVFYQIPTFKDNLPMLYLLVFTSSLSTISGNFTKGIGKIKIFAANGIFHTVVLMTLNILFLVVFEFGIKGYFYAYIIANIISFLFVFLSARLQKYLTLNFDKMYIKDMLRYSFPLVPNTIFWWIMKSSDRYVIIYMLDSSANGLYSVAHKIPTLISTISHIFFQAWQLSSVEEAKSKDKNKFYTNVFKLTAMMLILISSGFMIVLQPVYKIWLDPAYYEGWRVVPLLFLASIFSSFSSFLGTNYVAMKKTKGTLFTTLFGAVLNLILNLILTPFMGLEGTALATAIAFAATWIIRSIDTRKFARIKYEFKSFSLPLLILIVQIMVLTFWLKSIVLQSIFFIVIFLIYFKEIFNMLNKVIRSLKKSKKLESFK